MRSGVARRSEPAHATGQPAPDRSQPRRRASRANRPQGRCVRSLKNGSSAVVAPHDDLLLRHPAGHQLLAVGRDQVHQPVVGAIGPGHAGKERSRADDCTQRPRHFVGDLVALAVHGRPDEGMDAPALRPPLLHGAQGRPHGAGSGPAPAGMDGGQDARFGIDQGQRNAVRHHDHERDPGSHRDEDVGVGQGVVVGRACRGRARRARRVSLVHRAPGGQRPGLRAWCRTLRPPGSGLRRHSGVVAHVQAEIEGVVRWRRDAAVSCRHGHVDSESRSFDPAHQWRERGIGHASRPY